MTVQLDPPTELAISALNPDGSVLARWGPDEQAVGDVPKGLTLTTSDPGGYKDCQLNLARRLDTPWSDLQILRPIRVYGAGGRTAWEGRLQEIPGHEAEDTVFSPGAVGHSARLEDDPSFAEIYMDRDISGFGAPSLARAAALAAESFSSQANVAAFFADVSTDGSGLGFDFSGVAKAAGAPFPGGELYYYGGGVDIGRVYFDQRGDATTTWIKEIGVSQDDLLAGAVYGTNYDGVAEALGQSAPVGGDAVAGKKYAVVRVFNTAGGPYTMTNFQRFLNVVVVGRHGLPIRGAWPTTGLYGSDVIADVVARSAPDLNFTTGAAGSIQPTTFPIPHLVFKEGVKGADAILGVNAFHQHSWGVYEEKTFFWRPPTSYRKRWRVRRSKGHQVELLGPQADDAINGVVVTFTDAAGQTRVVGPPGCRTAYTTSAALADTRATNPVNAAGIERKWAEVKLQFTTTVRGALAVGAAYLTEKLNSVVSRGSVVVTGIVEDENGVLFPSWCMRAGDAAIVTDGDAVERGIISTSYDHDTRTCTANFDTTPHKVEALMERMGIVLVGVTE